MHVLYIHIEFISSACLRSTCVCVLFEGRTSRDAALSIVYVSQKRHDEKKINTRLSHATTRSAATATHDDDLRRNGTSSFLFTRARMGLTENATI